jgi:hypothetical protein
MNFSSSSSSSSSGSSSSSSASGRSSSSSSGSSSRSDFANLARSVASSPSLLNRLLRDPKKPKGQEYKPPKFVRPIYNHKTHHYIRGYDDWTGEEIEGKVVPGCKCGGEGKVYMNTYHNKPVPGQRVVNGKCIDDDLDDRTDESALDWQVDARGSHPYSDEGKSNDQMNDAEKVSRLNGNFGG